MTIDAHQHFWHFDPVRDAWITEGSMSVIRRDFLPSDLSPILQQNGIDGCIAVQADQSEMETHFLLELAAQYDFIKGVVGWVDLKADNLSERLDYYTLFPKLKGFRHILQGEKPEFMLQPRFTEGVRLLGQKGFTYDILVFPKHLKAVKVFLKKCENQPFVIDHLAKPYIKRGLIKEWAKDIRSIAKHENVSCKISGMVTEADWQNWKESDFTPYLDTILEAFGTDRVMYGSDWPVCLVAASYEKQFSIVKNYIKKLSDTEGDKIMGDNAARFYKTA
ncbi:MAG: amidohydrolase family protein [Saprospiraceae bacterium]|nr:amidohydrolase family protein [Saprospiraceae bacterium]